MADIHNIETGRHIKLERSERHCDKSSTGAIEIEQHCLLKYSTFNEYRKVIEKQLTGTGAIKRQIPLLKPKREINKYVYFRRRENIDKKYDNCVQIESIGMEG